MASSSWFGCVARMPTFTQPRHTSVGSLLPEQWVKVRRKRAFPAKRLPGVGVRRPLDGVATSGVFTKGALILYSLPNFAFSAHLLPHFATCCHMMPYFTTCCPHFPMTVHIRGDRGASATTPFCPDPVRKPSNLDPRESGPGLWEL